MFGTFAFKNELKNHFNTMCQHPYDPKRTFCKKCDKNENDNYIIKLDEARYTHKSALLNAQKKFFCVKTKYEMFKLNLIAYHWQFKFYFDKKGYLPDIDKVLESHNYQYKDFYKELHIQKNCIFI